MINYLNLQEENKMNYLFGVLLGYIAHDAIKPTAIGKVLDKVSLPSDLIVKPTTAPSQTA